MYKVKFLASGDVFDLIGFKGNKIIIRFNNNQSVGTIPKTGYQLLGNKTWEELKKEINND